jgi:hypothetical protein
MVVSHKESAAWGQQFGWNTAHYKEASLQGSFPMETLGQHHSMMLMVLHDPMMLMVAKETNTSGLD